VPRLGPGVDLGVGELGLPGAAAPDRLLHLFRHLLGDGLEQRGRAHRSCRPRNVHQLVERRGGPDGDRDEELDVLLDLVDVDHVLSLPGPEICVP
jgi:hypothetical protein